MPAPAIFAAIARLLPQVMQFFGAAGARAAAATQAGASGAASGAAGAGAGAAGAAGTAGASAAGATGANAAGAATGAAGGGLGSLLAAARQAFAGLGAAAGGGATATGSGGASAATWSQTLVNAGRSFVQVTGAAQPYFAQSQQVVQAMDGGGRGGPASMATPGVGQLWNAAKGNIQARDLLQPNLATLAKFGIELAKMPRRLADFGDSLVNVGSTLAHMNGQMSAALMQLRAQRYLREMQFAAGTSRTFSGLVGAQSKLEDKLAPYLIFSRNAMNILVTGVLRITSVGITIAEKLSVLDDLIRLFNNKLGDKQERPPLADLVLRGAGGEFGGRRMPPLAPNAPAKPRKRGG